MAHAAVGAAAGAEVRGVWSCGVLLARFGGWLRRLIFWRRAPDGTLFWLQLWRSVVTLAALKSLGLQRHKMPTAASFRRRRTNRDLGQSSDHGASFKAELDVVRRQLRVQEQYTKWVLHPGKTNSMLNIWDCVTSTALVYTMILTPLEAAFFSTTLGVAAWLDPWFLINRLLDAVFLIDMIVHFFLAYQALDAFGGLVWIVDQRKIAKHYVATW